MFKFILFDSFVSEYISLKYCDLPKSRKFAIKAAQIERERAEMRMTVGMALAPLSGAHRALQCADIMGLIMRHL